MKKGLIISLVTISILNGYKANAHSFKSDNLKNFYGNARVYFGYQIGMNEQVISDTQKSIPATARGNSNIGSYVDFDGNTNEYDIYKPTNHALSVAAGYNFYYKGLSDIIHPFIGVKAQINIPLYYMNSEKEVGMLYKTLTGNNLKDNTRENITYEGQDKMYLFNVLEFSGKIGTKIVLTKNVSIEPYVGIGKVLSVLSHHELNIASSFYSAGGAKNYYYDNNGEETDDKTFRSKPYTLFSTSYSIGADVVFDIAKQTFTAGLEYKFINYSITNAELAADIDSMPRHYLSFNFGYQFL